MAKQLIIEHDGKEYTLEFTLRSIKQMEDSGVDLTEGDKAPVSLVFALFKGALYKHHPKLTDAVIWEMLEEQGDFNGLGSDLAEMFKDALESVSGTGETKRKRNW